MTRRPSQKTPPKLHPVGFRRLKTGEQPLGNLASKAAAGTLTAPTTLIHVTTVQKVRQIMRDGGLRQVMCKVFEQKLVYFFLYRPAYRPANANDKTDYLTRFPAALIASPEFLGPPFHVYPMDTGGAVDGRFDDHANLDVRLEEYALGQEIKAALGHIQWMYGSIEKYFRAEPRGDLLNILPAHEIEAISCVHMAELALPATTLNDPDDRASAIEIAYKRDIRLAEHVKAIIIPYQLLEDKGIKDMAFIEQAKLQGVEILHYDWKPNSAPANYHKDVTEQVRFYLEREGVLPRSANIP